MLYDWLYVVYSSDYSFLNIVSAKLLSMIFILLGYGKVEFCETFAKRRTLQKSGREVLREEIFESKNIIFYINYATHCDLFLTFIVLNLFPRSGQFVGPTSR